MYSLILPSSQQAYCTTCALYSKGYKYTLQSKFKNYAILKSNRNFYEVSFKRLTVARQLKYMFLINYNF